MGTPVFHVWEDLRTLQVIHRLEIWSSIARNAFHLSCVFSYQSAFPVCTPGRTELGYRVIKWFAEGLKPNTWGWTLTWPAFHRSGGYWIGFLLLLRTSSFPPKWVPANHRILWFLDCVSLTVQQIPHLSLRELASGELGGSPSWITGHYFTRTYFFSRACVPEHTRPASGTGLCLGPSSYVWRLLYSFCSSRWSPSQDCNCYQTSEFAGEAGRVSG